MFDHALGHGTHGSFQIHMMMIILDTVTIKKLDNV